MHLAKFAHADHVRFGMVHDDSVIPLVATDEIVTLFDLLNSGDPKATASSMKQDAPIAMSDVRLLAPIDKQEVWAAGVTYKRSKTARMEESEAAASCYDRVYESDRPELFMKATPQRVVGPSEGVRIRKDATWNVPEPEFTLVLDANLKIVGYTVGNDMSSRDIEGENPLYLPQAKMYDACCSLGPWVTLADDYPNRDTAGIQVTVHRDGQVAFSGATSLEQLARKPEDLVGWLGRDTSFSDGAFLLTGTGIVPDSDFTLLPNDVVEISIDGIGTLSNPVVQGG